MRSTTIVIVVAIALTATRSGRRCVLTVANGAGTALAGTLTLDEAGARSTFQPHCAWAEDRVVGQVPILDDLARNRITFCTGDT